jgi:hypothetical protein
MFIPDPFVEYTHEQKVIISLFKRIERLTAQRNLYRLKVRFNEDLQVKIELLESEVLMLKHKLKYEVLR